MANIDNIVGKARKLRLMLKEALALDLEQARDLEQVWERVLDLKRAKRGD